MAGSSELFSNEAFNSRIVKATEIIEKREREGVPIKIIGYSLGGILLASVLAFIKPRSGLVLAVRLSAASLAPAF